MKQGLIFRISVIVSAGIVLLSGCAGGSTSVTDFPSREVEIVVPFAPGGITDSAARVLAKEMEVALGSEVIVRNVDGGGGITGVSRVAGARPDGHTLLYTPDPQLENSVLDDDVPYSLTDFVTVQGTVENVSIAVVRADSDYKSLDDLRNASGQVRISAASVGGKNHVIAAGPLEGGTSTVRFVPYAGAAPAMEALIGGNIDMIAASPVEALPYLKSEDLRPLAVVSSPSLAESLEIPTYEEAGFEEWALRITNGLVAPAGTPEEVLADLRAAAKEAVESPAMDSFREENSLELLSEQERSEWAEGLGDSAKVWGDALADLGLKLGG